jgi:phospholipid N-methyltransferase
MKLKFLKQLIMNPREIGSVAPSSNRLASELVKIAQNLSDDKTTFLELGPGTGVITEMLFNQLMGEQDLIALEKNPHFYQTLKKKKFSSKVVLG